jgi:hypothetical protein
MHPLKNIEPFAPAQNLTLRKPFTSLPGMTGYWKVMQLLANFSPENCTKPEVCWSFFNSITDNFALFLSKLFLSDYPCL